MSGELILETGESPEPEEDSHWVLSNQAGSVEVNDAPESVNNEAIEALIGQNESVANDAAEGTEAAAEGTEPAAEINTQECESGLLEEAGVESDQFEAMKNWAVENNTKVNESLSADNSSLLNTNMSKPEGEMEDGAVRMLGEEGKMDSLLEPECDMNVDSQSRDGNVAAVELTGGDESDIKADNRTSSPNSSESYPTNPNSNSSCNELNTSDSNHNSFTDKHGTISSSHINHRSEHSCISEPPDHAPKRQHVPDNSDLSQLTTQPVMSHCDDLSIAKGVDVNVLPKHEYKTAEMHQNISPQHKAMHSSNTVYSSTSKHKQSEELSCTSGALKLKDHKEQAKSFNENYIQDQLALALSKDEDDDLDDIMSELDAELLSGPNISSVRSPIHSNDPSKHSKKIRTPNGMAQPNLHRLQEHNRQLLNQLKIRDEEINALTAERDAARDTVSQHKVEPKDNTDNFYLPQIEELEKTIVHLQTDLQMTKDKLASHDAAARQAVTTLQRELKARVEQVTKMYEEAVKEKDSMVVTFASSEARVMEMKKAMEKMDNRLREALRDKENILASLKASKVDKQKAITAMEQKGSELSSVMKEVEKLKEAVSSSDYRVKWFQNKLKDELEAHKETKSNLDKTAAKLKETKEETEIIRRECQAIVKKYQESEEIKSNSLDKELKMKESQLRLQTQEWNDNQQAHEKTKQEFESLKTEYQQVLGQVNDLKEQIHSLESSLADKESETSKSNELLNKQKSDITALSNKVKEMETLEDNFHRAQQMIQTLDKDISELKVSNRDLVKDMEACQQRESKMLGLQSELSRSNACLRSENTTLNNKVCNQTGELERMKIEIQHLDTTIRNLTDALEEEKKRNQQSIASLTSSLNAKTQECLDFKQKWEDEIDTNKTLKRRHASNVKDLTRQLQQTKRRLEILEGNAETMGSRSNSNGSLNSVADANNVPAANHSSAGASQASATSQEFPVITEQVEIDKHVLIERIVRLQKSHARKNEKLEFLGEHIQQLLAEIKKKTKIIQSYVMREEAGTLSSEDSDANKNLLSRKGGIMASVYSLHQQDGTMTLDLSLQINKKLQAVLEDTLLKNITLKENLDTLGEEISRLSQVNRKLQLHLHDLENAEKT